MISLSIKPQEEIQKITTFLNRVRKKTGIDRVILGMSGGIDSTTVFYLLKAVYKAEYIYPAILNFYPRDNNAVKRILMQSGIPKNNILDISIKPMVEEIEKRLLIDSPVRKGNLMARVRMITLFDQAKKVNGLVCGTENRSERILGYFTRFGDAASDLEPISHLYKTQIYELAKYLKVPEEIVKARPTAGLWEGQTDEDELGFTYREADQVLHLYFDKNLKADKIKKLGLKKTDKIINRALANTFKSVTPYHIHSRP